MSRTQTQLLTDCYTYLYGGDPRFSIKRRQRQTGYTGKKAQSAIAEAERCVLMWVRTHGKKYKLAEGVESDIIAAQDSPGGLVANFKVDLASMLEKNDGITDESAECDEDINVHEEEEDAEEDEDPGLYDMI